MVFWLFCCGTHSRIYRLVADNVADNVADAEKRKVSKSFEKLRF